MMETAMEVDTNAEDKENVRQQTTVQPKKEPLIIDTWYAYPLGWIRCLYLDKDQKDRKVTCFEVRHDFSLKTPTVAGSAVLSLRRVHKCKGWVMSIIPSEVIIDRTTNLSFDY